MDKKRQYQELLPQVKGLLEGETNTIANMANISAILKTTFNFFWVGFYIVEGNELILGPFQGPIACTRIQKGRGVCGTAFEKQATIIVPDVHQFPGHIACNAASRSEIVVPILNNGKCFAVLDIDSDQLEAFDEVDKKFLETICTYLPI